MCVIIVKRKGVDMPAANILHACASANPHGFGFASDSRTFRTLDLREFLRELAKVDRDENCIIHFRYATHGSVKTENCHPFTIGSVRFMHNGILDIEPHGDMTDSETAFRDIIWPNIHFYGLDSVNARKAIESVIGGSRFAILMNGRLRTYGQFIEMNGLLFSNLNFMGRMRYGVKKIYSLQDDRLVCNG